MKKQFFSIVLSIFVIVSALAQNIPVDPNVRIGTLQNGMKYYIQKNIKPEKKVELRLAVNVGSVMEDDDQKGLAHFMEHMNFNGSKNFPDNKLIDFLQSIGIKFGQHLNAYTVFDETVYELPVPLDKPGNLDAGLKVMEDWAFNATLSDKEINKERGVVLEELRLGLGAEQRMRDKYIPKIFYNSKYAERLPIGDKNTLQNFKPEAIRRFYKDWYRPNLMALIVVGDINVDEVEAKIKKNFSPYKNPQNERPRTIAEVPNHKETFVVIESDPEATRSLVQLMYNELGNRKIITTEADFNQYLVESLFSNMLNYRLQELIYSATPPFTEGFVTKSNLIGTKDTFKSIAVTQDGKQLSALKVLMEETERAKRFGFSQSELDRAKAEMLSSIENTYNNREKIESEAFAGMYIRNFLYKNIIAGIEWEFNQNKKVIPTITLDQVNNVLKNYIRDENRIVIITGPRKDNIVQPTEAQVLAVFDEVKNAQLTPYADKTTIKNLVDPINSKGKIVKSESDSKLGTTTFTLSNGAKVTYKKTNFKEDEIVFSATSLGGTSSLSNSDLEKTEWAFPALGEAGFNTYSKNDISKFLSGKQVSTGYSVASLSLSFGGSTTKKDFETLFQIVYGYFTGLNYDPASFNSYKIKEKTVYDNSLSNPQIYFENEVSKYIYQKNPRFLGIIPDEKAWEKTDYKLAYDFYRQKTANAGNFHFYFVGNVDEAQLKKYAEQYLASLPSTGKTETYKDLGYRPLYTSVNKTIKKGKDPKSLVQIIYKGETKYDEKENLAMKALGKVATIKIIEKLREEEGGIYGGGAIGFLSKIPYGEYTFSINFPCGPENAEKLTKIAIAEVQKLAERGPEQKDLDKFKEGEMNDYSTDMKSNIFWLQNIANYQLEGGDKYEILNYVNNVKALTTKDLQTVAKKYLTKNQMIFTLMPEVEIPKTDSEPKADASQKVGNLK